MSTISITDRDIDNRKRSIINYINFFKRELQNKEGVDQREISLLNDIGISLVNTLEAMRAVVINNLAISNDHYSYKNEAGEKLTILDNKVRDLQSSIGSMAIEMLGLKSDED